MPPYRFPLEREIGSKHLVDKHPVAGAQDLRIRYFQRSVTDLRQGFTTGMSGAKPTHLIRYTTGSL